MEMHQYVIWLVELGVILKQFFWLNFLILWQWTFLFLGSVLTAIILKTKGLETFITSRKVHQKMKMISIIQLKLHFKKKKKPQICALEKIISRVDTGIWRVCHTCWSVCLSTLIIKGALATAIKTSNARNFWQSNSNSRNCP